MEHSEYWFTRSGHCDSGSASVARKPEQEAS